jgi:hypothetical protein
MMTERNGKSPYKWTIVLLAVITLSGAVWNILRGGLLQGQSGAAPVRRDRAAVFSPAHSSVGQAIRHFFFIRSDPQQPIAYTHKVHLEDVGLACVNCHTSVETGPKATIPNITACMMCHESIATEHPEIQKMAAYQKRGEDIPWERVYGFNDEAHVRFNHAPHIRASVACATCHGDLNQMTVAQRVVDHTMGFCMDCHDQRQVSNDCNTCHY